MTPILILLALAITVHFMRRPRVHGSMIPVSNARNLFLWGQKFDAEFPVDSEARLALQARGTTAKRRIVAHLRNRQRINEQEELKRAHPLSGYGPRVPILTGVQRIGDGPLIAMQLQVLPLGSIEAAAKQEVPIIVRRPRLSLAR